MSVRIEVKARREHGASPLISAAHTLGFSKVRRIHARTLYFLSEHPGAETLQRLCAVLLADPVTEEAHWGDSGDDPHADTHQVEVAFRPGVTDVAARELERSIREMGLPPLRVATGIRYLIEGELAQEELRALARRLLSNATIQHFRLGPIAPTFAQEASPDATVERVSLDGLSDSELVALSQRRLLSLDRDEMRAIRDHFATQGRPPTDAELETLAQTWSEHCAHKTFRARIDLTPRGGRRAPWSTRTPSTGCWPATCGRPPSLWPPVGALGLRGQRRHRRLRRSSGTWPSRSRPTTTPRPSSPSAGPTPASVAWSAT